MSGRRETRTAGIIIYLHRVTIGKLAINRQELLAKITIAHEWAKLKLMVKIISLTVRQLGHDVDDDNSERRSCCNT